MMKTIGVATALLALVAVLWVQPADSIKCYKCNLISGGACRVPQADTTQKECINITTCKATIVTPGPTVDRDCGDSTTPPTGPNGTCDTTVGITTCKHYCTGDLCNVQAGAGRAAALAVLTAVMSLVVLGAHA